MNRVKTADKRATAQEISGSIARKSPKSPIPQFSERSVSKAAGQAPLASFALFQDLWFIATHRTGVTITRQCQRSPS